MCGEVFGEYYLSVARLTNWSGSERPAQSEDLTSESRPQPSKSTYELRVGQAGHEKL